MVRLGACVMAWRCTKPNVQFIMQEFETPIVAPWPKPGKFKRIVCESKTSQHGNHQLHVDAYAMEGYQMMVGVPSMSAIGRALASKCIGMRTPSLAPKSIG